MVPLGRPAKGEANTQGGKAKWERRVIQGTGILTWTAFVGNLDEFPYARAGVSGCVRFGIRSELAVALLLAGIHDGLQQGVLQGEQDTERRYSVGGSNSVSVCVGVFSASHTYGLDEGAH